MDTQKLIEIYVGDVTRHLPRKMRADVGSELSALLAEELHGKTADEATEALRAFGRPSQVAARYHPMFAIIDPADTRAYLLASLAGLVVLALIAAPVIARYGKDASNLLMLGWLGFLTIWFGIKGWAIRRWPSGNQWRPRDRDAASRFGSAALILVILLGIVCYGAPQWLFAQLTHGGRLAPMFDYAEGFQAGRLPWLLGVWGIHVLLLAVVLIEGRWRFATRVIALALNLAVIVILTGFRFGGPIFANPQTDFAAKPFIALAIGVVLIDVAVRLYKLPGGRMPVRKVA